MPDHLIASFTPTPVDRDAMLFAAGRASAPSRRPWQAATIMLFGSHLLLLAWWCWPRTQPVSEPPVLSPPHELDPQSYLAMSRRYADTDDLVGSTMSYRSFDGPPLTLRSTALFTDTPSP
jgi:hypothetical protein